MLILIVDQVVIYDDMLLKNYHHAKQMPYIHHLMLLLVLPKMKKQKKSAGRVQKLLDTFLDKPGLGLPYQVRASEVSRRARITATFSERFGTESERG